MKKKVGSRFQRRRDEQRREDKKNKIDRLSIDRETAFSEEKCKKRLNSRLEKVKRRARYR